MNVQPTLHYLYLTNLAVRSIIDTESEVRAMKYFEIFWRSYGETYVKTFSHMEESYLNNFIRDLQERLSVDYIEKVTHENIPC